MAVRAHWVHRAPSDRACAAAGRARLREAGSILAIAPVLADGAPVTLRDGDARPCPPPQLPERRRGTQAPRACVLALGGPHGGSQRRLCTGAGIGARQAQEEL